MSLTGGFQAGDVVRTYRWACDKPWEGKILAMSQDGRSLAVVDLTITLGPEYPKGSHVVRAVCADEVYLVRKVGKGG